MIESDWRPMLDFAGAVAAIRAIESRRAWRTLIGMVSLKPINVEYRPRLRGAWALGNTIALGGRDRRWTLGLIVHEMAHVAVTYQRIMPSNRRAWGPEAGHGRQYCAAYLQLTGIVFGRDSAARLRREMVALKVKHRKPRILSDCMRAALSDRMAAIRAARPLLHRKG